MKPAPQKLEALQARFADLALTEFRDQARVAVPAAAIHDVLRMLKEELGFDFLVDITCVDYLHYPAEMRDRFGLAYLLADTQTNERITLRVFLNDPEPTLPTAVDLWEGANWMEREVWDMFGVRFAGHPDLRRILLPEEFTAFPLRKDYPLQGRGERHNLPVLRRGQTEPLPPPLPADRPGGPAEGPAVRAAAPRP